MRPQKVLSTRQEPEKTTVQSAYRPSVSLNVYKGAEQAAGNSTKERRSSKVSAR